MCGDGARILAKSLLPELSVPLGGSQLDFITEDTAPSSAAGLVEDETIVYHGTIITMARGKFNPVEAFATRQQMIVAVGTLAEVEEVVGVGAKKVDCTGKCILPGLIDPHIHLLMTALVTHPKHMVDFSYPRVKNRQGALDLVKQAAEAETGTKWISGYGYDPSLVAEHPDLTLQMLDEVAGDGHPVFILNQSGHFAYLNTAGFKAAKIGTRPEDPGYPSKDPNFQKDGNGKLTGVIVEEAVTIIAPFLPKLQPHEVLASAREVLRTWASRGITTVFDCGIGHLDGLPDLALIREATALRSVGPPLPRFRGAIAIQAIEHLLPVLDILRPPPWRLDNIQVYGIKFWLDGSTQGFTAALHEPYLDSRGTGIPSYGILNYRAGQDLSSAPDDDRLFNTMRPFAAAGWQIVCHSNGSRALDQALRVYGRVFAAHPEAARRHMHRLEHVTADVSAAQLARAARLGLGVSHLMAHVRKWGPAFEDWVLGPERAGRIDPVADDIGQGVTYSFHSDSPISTADPLQCAETATGRWMDEDGQVLGEGQRVSVEEALAGVTVNAARQVGVLDEVGTIEVGKKADFVVLDRDVRETHGRLRRDVTVLETWIGGKLAFKKGGLSESTGYPDAQ